MKKRTHLIAVAVLAAALSLPSVALADQRPESGSDRGPIARLIEKVKKAVGVRTNTDVIVPPLPGKP